MQLEEAADGVDHLVCTGGVGGRGRAQGAPRVVEELVAESRHGSRDLHPVGMVQVGAGGEEAVELAAQRSLGAAAEPANCGGGGAAVRRRREADGRTTFDNRLGSLGRTPVDRNVVLLTDC